MAAFLIWMGYIYGKATVFVIAAVAVILFAIFACKHVESMGVYINCTNVYYKKMRCKKVKVQDIAGVKMLQTHTISIHRGIPV